MRFASLLRDVDWKGICFRIPSFEDFVEYIIERCTPHKKDYQLKGPPHLEWLKLKTEFVSFIQLKYPAALNMTEPFTE